MTPIRRRVLKVLKPAEAGGIGGAGRFRAKAEAFSEAAEKSRKIKEGLELKMLREGVIQTPEIRAIIEDLSKEAEPSKSPHAKRLADVAARESARQKEVREKLNEEIKNDPEMRKLIVDMNAKIEQVTTEDVIELIRFMKEKYGHKIK